MQAFLCKKLFYYLNALHLFGILHAQTELHACSYASVNYEMLQMVLNYSIYFVLSSVRGSYNYKKVE